MPVRLPLYWICAPVMLAAIAASGSVSAQPRPAMQSMISPPPATVAGSIGMVRSRGSFSDRRRVFIENKGQWGARARLLLRGDGLDMWITDHGIVYDLESRDRVALCDVPTVPAPPAVSAERSYGGQPQPMAVFLDFLGAAPAASAHGLRRAPGHHNYFIGADRSRWAANVPLYDGARIEGLYDGIDAVFYLDDARPRYDLIVAPGADAGRIRMRLRGAGRPRVDEEGSLVIETPLGELRQRELFAYQMRDGRREQVRCGFHVEPDGVVCFDVGSYDRRRELVIDPVVIVYSTYLGGSNADQSSGRGAGWDIAVDGGGDAYVIGTTGSADFPTLDPFQPSNAGGGSDVSVTKLDAEGTLVYSTYLGGSDWDEGWGIAVNGGHGADLTGRTSSTDFPTLNPAQPLIGGRSDAFVTKLDAEGSLIFSTYLGGAGEDMGADIATDDDGDLCVAGITGSRNFPLLDPLQPVYGGGLYDAFVTRLGADGTLVSSTYLGGIRDDEGLGIVVDASGSIHVTGSTQSANFPLLNPVQPSLVGGEYDYDAFVTKLAPGGALVYSTYLGGTLTDVGTDIAVDGSGNAYITGYTRSTNFPTLSTVSSSYGGGNGDAFVAKLGAGGMLLYSTYLGGSGWDDGWGIAVDGAGDAYVTGITGSADFPTLNTAPSYGGGAGDAFVAKLSTGGTLVHSTSFGGSGSEEGMGIAVDDDANAYVVGITMSADLPILYPMQPSFGGSTDGFVAKLSFDPVSSVPVIAAGPSVQLHEVCPVPAVDDIHVGYLLPEEAPVTLEIYASDGRLVERPVSAASRGAGDHDERLSLALLPPGTYTLRLVVAGEAQARRFVIVR